MLFLISSVIYRWALRHLGSNYSPCYDSHLPAVIVKAGPYRWIRHPMYLAKFIIGMATLTLSGSLWFVPTTIYFFIATFRTMQREELDLNRSLVGYQDYQRNTARLLPWLYCFLLMSGA
jgi:protein-S-isoprenylcysteine O-methyltransferase Ste14